MYTAFRDKPLRGMLRASGLRLRVLAGAQTTVLKSSALKRRHIDCTINGALVSEVGHSVPGHRIASHNYLPARSSGLCCNYHTASPSARRRKRTHPQYAMQCSCDPYAALRKHPELFDAGAGLCEDWLSPSLLQAVKVAAAGAEDPFSAILKVFTELAHAVTMHISSKHVH